tara:strand:- start:56 stop:439 length:384 start_codon:yes stop_codon:yes gene_type:complete
VTLLKLKRKVWLIKILYLILFFVFIVFFSINTDAAEILQINNPNTILVGDNNRSLYLSLYCIDINENQKYQATEILKRNFPRGTKVKIKPYGSNGDRLLAKIFRIDDETEMSQLLNNLNFSDKTCLD